MGKLTLIMGPMFAGKTTALLRIIENYEILRKSAIVVNHISDKRYGESSICSHNGQRRDAVSVDRLADAPCIMHDLVVIDEAQFFGDLRETITEWLQSEHHVGRHIVVAGLNGDASQKPFGQILDLIPLADEVIHLTALCLVCNDGTPAHFTIRCPAGKAVAGDAQVHVGGSDEYMAVCRKHLT